MANPTSEDIPIGDIRFFDDYVPALDAGDWTIRVDHAIEHDGAPLNVDEAGQAVPLGAVQQVVVSAPQFTIPPSAILNRYPPEGSTGRYGEVLPHVVFSDPMLPWERAMAGGPDRQPWLALLVVTPDELAGTAAASPTGAIATTVGEFLQPTSGVLKPTVEKEGDVADDDPCAYIQVPVATFRDIAPRLGELRFLAHCRQIDTGDRAILGLDEHGLFAVVVANRFPAVPAPGTAAPATNIAHLVSLEGLEPYLVADPDVGGAESVALLSLASWTFQSLPDNKEDFRGLFENLVRSEYDGTTYSPDRLWLRLPPPASGGTDGPVPARVRDGFVPVAYHTRTGEETFAWYRGPLTPVLTTPLQKAAPFPTGDAAIVYDGGTGVFDLSLAAAWQIGRALALSDRAFGQRLLALRRRAHRITDALLHRLRSDHFTADQIAALDHDSTVQDELIRRLDTRLLADIGQVPAPGPQSPAAPKAASGATDPVAEVRAFLAQAPVQQRLAELVESDLDPVARWLARLILLYPLPFDHLVADVRMLPIESLRFFYLDRNWTRALLDGALSIGMESSRETFFHEVTHGLLHRAAFEAAKVMRDRLRGVDPAPPEVEESLVSGFLLRSALVSGWPNLAVRPRLNGSDEPLKILRLDRLSPTVMLCLFWGVPDVIEFSEPQEGFRFGVDDDGDVPLRNLVAPAKDGDPALGVQLPGDPMFRVRDPSGREALCLRSAASRVLNLAPGSADGLVQKLAAANAAAAKTPVPALGPGALALQMVKSPEAIQFTTHAGSPT